ncbi:efflux RND transporter periplasmic adaptor subunit [Poriferisphaera sp. WC338]|uniref:efflux RND transporter periplasmic adaptor subunit n=1 Tax=Poriferisphaera sp. WC338 TaxID=3425129 RepID=UPI003D817782
MKSNLLVFLIFGAILGLIVLVGVYRASEVPDLTEEKNIPAKTVYTHKLVKEKQTIQEAFYGLIEPTSRVDMAFQISGRVTQLGSKKNTQLDEGQRVKKDQVIAKLEHDRYEAQLTSALASKEQASASKAAAEAQIADAIARLDDAKLERGRVASLYGKNAATKRELERSDLAVKLAKAAVETANAGKLQAIAEFDAAEAARLVAAVNLKDTTLLSPIDGTVAYVPSELGQMVTPADNVVTIVDINKVNLVVGVVERKLGLLHLNQEVEVVVEALRSSPINRNEESATQQTVSRKGIIKVIPPIADDKTGLFNVEIEIDNADRTLRPGMIGKAEINVREIEAYAIPVTAAKKRGNRVTVFMAQPQQNGEQVLAKQVDFEPLYINRDAYLTTVLPGNSDECVVQGMLSLVDGQPIKVVDNPGSGNDHIKPSIMITAKENAPAATQ